MKRFIFALVFCTSLLGVLSFSVVRSTRAKEDLIQVLLDLPAPPPPNPLMPAKAPRRPEFFDKKNPPRDDAPIEDLLEYWAHQSGSYRELGHNVLPSGPSLERILDAVRKDPSTVGEYVKVFAGSARAARLVKEIYDEISAGQEDQESSAGLRRWLQYNSPYFTGDLAKAAESVADVDEYVTNQEDLLTLSRYDWDRAKGHVNRLYGDAAQPTSQVLAKWALYRRALDDDAVGDVDRYRDELKAVVENRSATDGQRDLALDALFKEKEWPGRDDWYFSLLEDESLGDLRVGGRSYTGLTTLIYYAPEGKYAEKMAELAASKKPAVRAAAVRNLLMMVSPKRPEVIRALLPWLEDPKWARDVDGSRMRVVEALAEIKMPESVTGLLAVLDERDPGAASGAKSNSNRALLSNAAANAAWNVAVTNVSANTMTRNSDVTVGVASSSYPYRPAAVAALSHQGDFRATGPLRRVFSQVEPHERKGVVEAILNCNGFSTAEQVAALEAQAGGFRDFSEAYEAASKEVPVRSPSNSRGSINVLIPDGDDLDEEFDPEQRAQRLRHEAAIGYLMENSPVFGNSDDIQSLLGAQLMSEREVTDDLARAAIKRAAELEKSDPALADIMRSMISNWKSRYVSLFMLDQLKSGRADSGVVIRLLTARKELRAIDGSAVADVRTGVPSAAGFAACLLESEADYAAVLDGAQIDAKKALLACGRLIRARLAVPEVAKLVQSNDKQLALAAERFLESEDSPEARRIVLSLHPAEAKILGATVAFRGGSNSINSRGLVAGLFQGLGVVSTGAVYFEDTYYLRELAATEKRLQKEVLGSDELLGVYAYENNFVRIYKDKAVFSWEEDESRYHERTLESAEFDDLKSFLARHDADGMAPFLSCSGQADNCRAKQLVMLSRHGGRRVFFRTSRPPEFQAGLDSVFKEMKRPPAKLRYWLEKDIPGLEVLYASKELGAEAVWRNGDDVRVLIADQDRRKEIDKEIERSYAGDDDTEESILKAEAAAVYRAQRRKFDHYAWRALSNGVLGHTVAQPPEIEYIPLTDDMDPPAGNERWKARAGNVEIRGGDGLYKIIAGRAERLFSGYYEPVVVSADGKWAVASKSDPNGSSGLVRIDLERRREFRIPLDAARYLVPIAFVESVGRFLVGPNSGNEDEHGDGSYSDHSQHRVYHWLDAATGVMRPAVGDFRPIVQQKYRRLQPTGTAFEYWAAIPGGGRRNETDFGIYSTRTFKMTPMLKLPRIRFGSQVMWIDGGKLYFVYNGHVLAAPLNRPLVPASSSQRPE